MNNNVSPQLQLAVDVLSLEEMVKTADMTYPYFDIIEIGTCLIVEEGLSAVEVAKTKYPDKECLADLKIMDAGRIEAISGFKRGSDIITVLAAADDVTISNAVVCAAEYGGQIMADLINVLEPAKRAKQLEDLGVDIVCVHTAYDIQSAINNPMAELKSVRSAVQCKVAVAGGLKRQNVREVVDAGANIVIVGSAVTRHPDPGSEAQAIYNIIHNS